MGRQPVNVLVFPFRKNEDGEYEYAIFKRADMGFWQGISGGVDGNEAYFETAKREAYEEAGIPGTCVLYKLNTIASIPANGYPASKEWGPKVYIIPQYYFAIEVNDPNLKLSIEHTEYKWVNYKDAEELLLWQSDKIGLFELNSRLMNEDMENC